MADKAPYVKAAPDHADTTHTTSVPRETAISGGPADTPGGTDMETLPTCTICQQPTTEDDTFGSAHTACVRRLLDSSPRR
jgi:hypothetical protein